MTFIEIYIILFSFISPSLLSFYIHTQIWISYCCRRMLFFIITKIFFFIPLFFPLYSFFNINIANGVSNKYNPIVNKWIYLLTFHRIFLLHQLDGFVGFSVIERRKEVLFFFILIAVVSTHLFSLFVWFIFFFRVANSTVEYSAFKCDSNFYTFLWSNGFVHTIGRVCKTTTDPERNEWKKQHVVSIVVSMENSKNISLLLDRAKIHVSIFGSQQNKFTVGLN